MVTIAKPETADSSNDSNNNADDSDSNPFDERDEQFEHYWGNVDAERFVQKYCMTHDIFVDDGMAKYLPHEGDSPLAELGLHYYRTKKEIKSEINERDLNDDQDLFTYRDQFDEPEYDHVVIDANNAEDYELSPDQFDEGEQIHLPDNFEMPNQDGKVQVWYDNEVNDVLESLKEVNGIGDQMAGKALNQLQEDGHLPDDL